MEKSRARKKNALVQGGPKRSPDQKAVVERFFADLGLPDSSSTMTKTAKASRKDRKRKQRCTASPDDTSKIHGSYQIDATLADIYLLHEQPDVSRQEPVPMIKVDLTGPEPVARTVRRPLVMTLTDRFSCAVVAFEIVPERKASDDTLPSD